MGRSICSRHRTAGGSLPSGSVRSAQEQRAHQAVTALRTAKHLQPRSVEKQNNPANTSPLLERQNIILPKEFILLLAYSSAVGSHHRTVWVGRDLKKDLIPPPVLGRVTFPLARLLCRHRSGDRAVEIVMKLLRPVSYCLAIREAQGCLVLV